MENERPGTHVGDNGENGHPVEDFLPGSDVVGFGCHGASELSRELPGVHSDLDDVVDKRQQRCQREGGDEQRDEAKLDHWERKRREGGVRLWTWSELDIDRSKMVSDSLPLCPESLPISRYSSKRPSCPKPCRLWSCSQRLYRLSGWLRAFLLLHQFISHLKGHKAAVERPYNASLDRLFVSFLYECALCLQLDHSRDQGLLDVAPHLFTGHHDHQLGGQLDQTATRVALNAGRLREALRGL